MIAPHLTFSLTPHPAIMLYLNTIDIYMKRHQLIASRKINKSPMTLEDPEKGFLKKMLTEPPVKKIDLHFPLGLEVSARNLRGVTIKDALDAIYKQFRKKVSLL